MTGRSHEFDPAAVDELIARVDELIARVEEALPLQDVDDPARVDELIARVEEALPLQDVDDPARVEARELLGRPCPVVPARLDATAFRVHAMGGRAALVLQRVVQAKVLASAPDPTFSTAETLDMIRELLERAEHLLRDRPDLPY